jgi:hypothetical protein
VSLMSGGVAGPRRSLVLEEQSVFPVALIAPNSDNSPAERTNGTKRGAMCPDTCAEIESVCISIRFMFFSYDRAHCG